MSRPPPQRLRLFLLSSLPPPRLPNLRFKQPNPERNRLFRRLNRQHPQRPRTSLTQTVMRYEPQEQTRYAEVILATPATLTETTTVSAASKHLRNATGQRRAIAVIITALLATACGVNPQRTGEEPATVPSPATAASVPTTEPTTDEGFRTAAQQIINSNVAGDWGGYWDRWDKESKKLITREEYIRRKQACPPMFAGAPVTVKAITTNPDGTKTAQVDRFGFLSSVSFRYEDGRWGLINTDLPVEILNDYKKSYEENIKTSKDCQKDEGP